MNKSSLCFLAKVGQTLATLLNSSTKLMHTVPTLLPPLMPVHTQCPAQCPPSRRPLMPDCPEPEPVKHEGEIS